MFSYDVISGSLLIFVETASRFPSQPTSRHILSQNRRRAVLVVTQFGVQHFGDGQAGVEADEIGQFEWAHGMIQTQFHALVDVFDRSQRLLQREARLVEEWDQQPIDDE